MEDLMITMEHPDLPGTVPAVASLEAFETVWKAKGFKLTKVSAAAVKALKAAPADIGAKAPAPEPVKPEPEENSDSEVAKDSEDQGKDE